MSVKKNHDVKDNARIAVEALLAEEDQSCWGRVSQSTLHQYANTLSDGTFKYETIPEDAPEYQGYNLRWRMRGTEWQDAMDLRQAAIDATLTIVQPPQPVVYIEESFPMHADRTETWPPPLQPDELPLPSTVDYTTPIQRRLSSAIADVKAQIESINQEIARAQDRLAISQEMLGRLWEIQGTV